MIRPEILAPAGDPEKLRFAVDYGADAVYLAGKAFGMRSASGNFSREELAQAVGTTRQTITSIEVGRYTASLPLAYKIARYFGLTIEEVFDFSDIEEE